MRSDSTDITTGKKPPAVERDRGIDMADAISMNPLAFSLPTAQEIRSLWRKLPSEEARVAMLDQFLERLDRLFVNDWAAMYEVITLIRDHAEYWQAQGYVSFEAYWAERGRFAFERLRDLESQHGFAATACPDFFDQQPVRPSTKSVDDGPNPNQPPVDILGDERAMFLWRLDLDNETVEYRRGFLDGRKAGSRCPRLRFRRLKLSFPRIAERILKGVYLVRQRTGKWRVDFVTAEIDAGLETKRKLTRSRVERAARLYEAMTEAERQEFSEQLGLG